MTDFKRVVIFGDMHLPFCDVKTLQHGLRYVKHVKPDLVVQIGDLVDNYCFSRFYKSPDLITPKEELKKARLMAELFWDQVHKNAPKAQRVQLEGNHDTERLEKASLMLAPALSSVVHKAAKELMTFDGVLTVPGYRDTYSARVQGEKVEFLHGVFSTTIAHVRHYGANVVMGHLHRGELQTDGELFGLNVGYLGDPDSPIFNYTRTKLRGWTSGIGVIDNEGPRFVSKRCLERY